MVAALVGNEENIRLLPCDKIYKKFSFVGIVPLDVYSNPNNLIIFIKWC